MNNYKYILEPYKGMKTRYTCPKCLTKKVFTRYIDTYNNSHLNDNVGKCSRLINCGYHYSPKHHFEDNEITSVNLSTKSKTKSLKIETPKINFISNEIMNKSIKYNYKKTNHFINFLANHWDKEVALELADLYNIGTSKYWNGATVFWQVDVNNNVRSGKIMLYNPINGKRIKEPFNYINWAHKVLNLENFNLKQCLFGEHLLNYEKDKPVAIVESEKTAIIASVYLPEYIWLACGSINNLNKERTSVLKGRSVFLYPDLGCYDTWNDKIPLLIKSAKFRTSTLLKEYATKFDKQQGLDIADYLLQFK